MSIKVDRVLALLARERRTEFDNESQPAQTYFLKYYYKGTVAVALPKSPTQCKNLGGKVVIKSGSPVVEPELRYRYASHRMWTEFARLILCFYFTTKMDLFSCPRSRGRTSSSRCLAKVRSC